MTLRHQLLAGLLLACLALPGAAAVYTWRDADGVLQFSDRAPPARSGDGQAQVRTIEVPQIRTVTTRRLPASLRDAGPSDAPATAGRDPVVMYSAAWCGVCKRARRYFEAQGIAFVEKDIDASAAARDEFRRLGGRGVPLILVGRNQLEGFSPAGFQRIYDGAD